MTAPNRIAALLAAIAIPASLPAHTAPQDVTPAEPAQQDAAPTQEAPVCGKPIPAQEQPAGNAAEGKNEKKQDVPVAKEVGAAAAGTAGQIGGAAVAGPIGAAVGGVVASKVGEAVGSLVKKKKKKPDQQQIAQDQSSAASGEPQMVCVTPGDMQQPQH